MKRALCVGINNYPGTANDLQGCVNDASDWEDLLDSYGFTVERLIDSAATRANIKSALRTLVENTKPGDVTVFTYSGHGTQVYDTSGDEEDGYDEALYVYDGVLKDDELRDILENLCPEATFVVIADSCFSGTVTRMRSDTKNIKRKFVEPENYHPEVPVKKTLSDSLMPELLISGCSDEEYSYDAYINGRYNGAFSRYAIDSIKANLTGTYESMYGLLRGKLPSKSYPQTPQLEGSDSNKELKLFEPKPVNEPNPEPEPTPDPVPDTQTIWDFLKWLWEWFLSLFK